MKQPDNCSPSKGNSTTKDLNTYREEEILNNEFQKARVKILMTIKKKHKSWYLTSKRV
jgi:hypothetical protein